MTRIETSAEAFRWGVALARSVLSGRGPSPRSGFTEYDETTFECTSDLSVF